MTPETRAKLEPLIEVEVNRIWLDLTNRQGVGNTLESCDEEIQDEIKNMLKNKILAGAEAGYAQAIEDAAKLVEIIGEQLPNPETRGSVRIIGQAVRALAAKKES